MSFRAETVRIALALALFASAVFAPWWLALAFAVALSLRFRAWEVIAAGIFYDLIWMPDFVSFTSFDSLPMATLVGLVLFLGLEPLRRRLLVGVF